MNGLLIKNAAEIVTPLGATAKYGKGMQEIERLENASIVIKDGVIEAVDAAVRIAKEYDENLYKVLDAAGKSVIPGFIDAHTHFIFGGYRADEFMARLSGKSYMEIMNAGGGIESTVKETRQMTAEKLYELGRARLDEMMSNGVTTVEGKSGYGLDYETEIKQLKVMKELNDTHPLEVVSTFMGAHAMPSEYKGHEEQYIDFIIEKVLPAITREGLAEFCDVFCEKGVFSVAAAKRLLEKAKAIGLLLKIHADEIISFGGAELAGELKTVSADHLLHASKAGIQALAQNKVVATLLPSTAFCLNEPFADARGMIDAGCAVALGSDYNPGSCFTSSVPLLLALAAIKMHMSIEETLTAMTLNGAAAINRARTLGSIEPGKQADLLILKYPSYKFLVYHTGANIIKTVIKEGNVIWANS